MQNNLRRFSAIVLLLAAAGIFALYLQRRSPQEGSERKHEIPRERRSVLLITVDTTRADRLEPYGAENVATPNLQRLASRGILFEDATAVAPITLVSHASILSGLYPFEHGVRNNGTHYASEDLTTLAEVLRDKGYRTAAFVSASVLERRYGLDQGFEVYDDDLSAGRDRSPRVVADRPAEATIASATSWLEGLGPEEDYFLWVHLYDPHANYSPPPPYRDQYRQRLYDGEIAYMDEQIGHLLGHPRVTTAEGEQAIVTVIADHGESLGEHGERTHGILAYDSTLHVPWILRVPGGPAGVRVSEPVGHVDLMPTILSLVDVKFREKISGRDLVPTIEGTRPPRDVPYYSEAYLPFYTYGWEKLKTMRLGRWKLIDAPTPELYQLSRDPQELSNVHEQQPGVAHDLKRDLDTWLERAENSDAEASLELDSEAAEKLRSLGYISVGSGRQKTDGSRPDPKDMIDLHVALENARFFATDRLYEQAIEQLEKVLRRDPENLSALVEMVRSYENLGNLDEARRIAEQVLVIDPDYQWIYITLARLETQAGNIEKALELTELAIQRDPKNPEARIQNAMTLGRLGRQRESQAALEAALQDHGEHPRLNALYASMVEVPQGKLDEAQARLEKVVTRDPFLNLGWLNLGRLLESRHRVPEAAESYRKGLLRQPDDALLHGSLGLLLAKTRERAESVQHLREAIRLSPQMRADLHVTLGGVLAEMGRFEEAQKEYGKVLEIHPDHPGARNNAAIALYRAGRLAEAKAALQQLIAEFPRQADAHNNLAAIAVDQRQWKAAEFHSRQTLEIDSEIAQAWNNLAISLEEQGKIAEARQSYERALAIEPQYWTARYNLGILFRKTEQFEEALEAFQSVLGSIPQQPDTHFELARIYTNLSNKEQARTHFNAFLRHAPSQHPRVAEARRLLEDL